MNNEYGFIINADTKAYQCNECGTRLKSLDSLNRHIRSHKGIHPYRLAL